MPKLVKIQFSFVQFFHVCSNQVTNLLELAMLVSILIDLDFPFRKMRGVFMFTYQGECTLFYADQDLSVNVF